MKTRLPDLVEAFTNTKDTSVVRDRVHSRETTTRSGLDIVRISNMLSIYMETSHPEGNACSVQPRDSAFAAPSPAHAQEHFKLSFLFAKSLILHRRLLSKPVIPHHPTKDLDDETSPRLLTPAHFSIASLKTLTFAIGFQRRHDHAEQGKSDEFCWSRHARRSC
jgi:hypothetical protein